MRSARVLEIVRRLIGEITHDDPLWKEDVLKNAVEGDDVSKVWLELFRELGIKVSKKKLPAIFVPVHLESIAGGSLKTGWYIFDTAKRKLNLSFCFPTKESCQLRCDDANRKLFTELARGTHGLDRQDRSGVEEKEEGGAGGTSAQSAAPDDGVRRKEVPQRKARVRCRY